MNKKMIKQEKFYSIDFEKLKGESMDTIAYFLGIMSYNEDYKYFDKIKHLLDIPEKPKTLEELQQELDEKFDDLLVKTKRKFAVSQQSAEYHYNQKFKKINDNFEYIKKWGRLPFFTLVADGQVLTNSGSSPMWGTVINIGNGDVGYYTNGTELRIYMPKKPNMIVRTFMWICLGFKWVNKK
jgi:hypothetical protein